MSCLDLVVVQWYVNNSLVITLAIAVADRHRDSQEMAKIQLDASMGIEPDKDHHNNDNNDYDIHNTVCY